MNTVTIPSSAERTVLYVSPKPDACSVDSLEAAGWHVAHAKTTQQAERMLERSAATVGLIVLPPEGTQQQLSELAACATRTDVTWVAQVQPGQAESEPVRRFILDYCFDFVTLPCLDERLVFVLGHAHGLSRLRESVVAPQLDLGSHQMIGQCDAMLHLCRGIDKCAHTGAPVFVAGESGTGKELTARAIHDRSSRAGKAYVAINCAAIPPTLLQSELFGHERGAFTGALQRKIGRIESADGGTLFLDEIGDMPHECQAVLLRFLQEGTIERVGGSGPIQVNVRVISATHVNLEAAVADGRFRADLYHRLCVLRLAEPPLRERGHDIKLLALHALAMHRKDGARKIRGFSSDAITAMFNYNWPGNVRELINCVRRAVVMAEGRFITAADLGLPDAPCQTGRTLAEIRNDAERAAVQEALTRHAYSLSGAAAELGISRATLYRLLNSIGLRSEQPAMKDLRLLDAEAGQSANARAPRCAEHVSH
ncbi:sigma-54-dependent Fis family transcriptional regulator [Trinickia terrae]|uniref:Sigma-54-dependent Fis family transcriptional regulator n=1 Tax=Trinickia terrae TaxID=2571161 RepID=A0A4U1IGA5_9BURK|nr:sigma-54 dependent transcriptional regulator [Trinickia terrae]TKC92605.1 sigma-54-dependent Fis family transcriptional regulator [Trinickia terrae]